MRYLSRFTFPDGEAESDFIFSVRRTCYDTYYPYGVLSVRGLFELEFEPVTLLYGGNGSGKTTALNVIAEKLSLKRDALYNRSSFFERYLRDCRAEICAPLPPESRVITSDDVFDFMLDVRAMNEGIDRRREALFEDYLDDKRRDFKLRSLADYDELKRVNLARSKTQSKYVRALSKANVREQSNGESAFYFFTQRIDENALYLLDEPENSLSPTRQLELLQYIENAARFFNCQFVIATHSPFLLAARGARVYDLDAAPAAPCCWTELPAVRAYHDFFEARRGEFVPSPRRAPEEETP